jgi:hypothetical protein
MYLCMYVCMYVVWDIEEVVYVCMYVFDISSRKSKYIVFTYMMQHELQKDCI